MGLFGRLGNREYAARVPLEFDDIHDEVMYADSGGMQITLRKRKNVLMVGW